MINLYPGEQWKTLVFTEKYINESRVEISNYGRIRTFNKNSNGNIINGSLTEGYYVLRLKKYLPQDAAVKDTVEAAQKEIAGLAEQRKVLKEAGNKDVELAEQDQLLADKKSALREMKKADLKKRTRYHHPLVHRLVADYFMRKPLPGQTIVAHLDYDKINNRAINLKWMTPEENYAHQKNSPHVKRDMELRWDPSKKSRV